MNKITVYEKPTCTTCKKVALKLKEKGVDYDKVNYYIKPFTKNKLKTLLKKMDAKPSDILRKLANSYKALDFKNKNYTENQILDFMIKDHDLIQRPIIEIGDKAVLARPVEKIDELF